MNSCVAQFDTRLVILIVLLLPSEYLVNRWNARHGPHRRPAPVPEQILDAEPARAQIPLRGKVTGVHDGDTITVHIGEEQPPVEVRLAGIDAPEMKQAYGGTAKLFLVFTVAGKTVELRETSKDRYGRTVATVIVDGGTNVNLAMVRAGMAWHAPSGSKDAALAYAEQEARAAKSGLWQDSDPVPPWEFRRKPKKA